MRKQRDNLNNVKNTHEVLNEAVEESGRWLEIDGETIVGVHSHRCQSGLTWVKYEGHEVVKPGYQWKNDRIVPPKVEIDEHQLRVAARKHITDVYPVWKQLNILREGDRNEIEKMGQFVDGIRKWSNDPKAKMDDLQKIKP